MKFSGKRYSRSLLTAAILFSLCASGYAEGTGDGGGEQAPSLQQGSTGGNGSGSNTVLPDLFTGTMSYMIPIEVPPGRNGMDPGLALLYRSSNGNGWVGMGWELEVGAIERSIKNGVTYDDAKDTFLFRMAGATIELVSIGVINGVPEYRAKIEGAFNRFKKLISPSGIPYWEVTDKAGTKYIFGYFYNRTNGVPSPFKKIPPLQYDPNDSTRIFKWCLNRVEDTNGNYTTFSYFQDQGQIYLDRIDYTSNGSLSPTNKVYFYREGREDAPVLYTSNFAVKTAYRLKTIEVIANGGLVRKYELLYDENSDTDDFQYSHISGRSLLTSVRQYGKDGLTTLPDITFKYTPLSSMNGIQEQTWTTSASNWGGSNYTWAGDFNGDGKTDIATANGGTIWVKRSLGNTFIEEVWATNAGNWGDSGYTWAGDFNGDGKMDIATAKGCNIWVKRSTGTSFVEEIWATNACSWGGSGYTWVGDFDGDGKTDIATAKGGTIWVKRSTGSSFTEEVWSTTAANWGTSEFTRVGDFNGDGKMDIVTANGSIIWVKRSVGSSTTGYSFVEEIWTTTAANWGGAGYTWVGDFNGDGRSDIATANGGNIWVKLSTGSSFNEQIWTTTAGNWGGAGYTRTGDFNGDGKTDIATASGGNIWIKRSTGFSFTEERWTTTATNWGGSGYTFSADFNGDGKTDVATANGGTIWVKKSNAFTVDMLRKIENGLGAKTSITYTPSTGYYNTRLPFPIQTLSSVTTSDGNGNVGTTWYLYSGGYYYIPERDFRGFNFVEVHGPTGPHGEQAVTATWFHQGNDTGANANNPDVPVGYMKGKPYRTKVDGSDGRFSSNTTINYDTLQSGTYYFNPQKEVITCLDAYSCSKQTKTVYAYDSFGNVTREDQYGDLSDSSDDRTIARSFGYNEAAWIVGLPKNESVYKGIGTAGDKVAETTYYYDRTSDCDTASVNQIPDKGKLTRIVRWNSDGASPETRMAYDSYGNLTCSRDANGNTTTIDYDGTHTFPITMTNPLRQKTVTQYYGVDRITTDKGLYGQVKSITDPNNAATVTEYDYFGRRTKVTQPDGAWMAVSYNNFGTVGSQHIRSDTSEGLSSWVYFDGLGRSILEKRTGPNGMEIAAQTIYDSRGLVKQSALPYFYGYDTPKFTTYTYDSVGRTIKAEMPDGTSTQRCYNDWVAVTVDAGGHKKRETRDSYGRLITVQEYKGAYSSCDTDSGKAYATTTYQNDVLGNLRFVTDAKGNQTEMKYDSLGRKTYMKDPDMGAWNYYYDLSGNLKSQQDANGRWIHFQYDALNRLRQKDYDNQKPLGSSDAVAVYTYDENTSYGKGRLTSVTVKTGSATYYYDPMGRVKREDKTVNGSAYTARYDYDGIGRPKERVYPDGNTLYYSYNGPVLSKVYDITTNYADYTGYNALGQPGRLKYGNGVLTDYTYYNSSNGICPDDNYRLCTINTSINGVTLQDLRFTYYDVGNVKGISDSSPVSQEMENDRLARLNNLGDMTYTYPPDGIRPHAVSSAGGNIYNYDNNGNMTSGAGRSITYSHENIPLSITANGITTNIDYNGFGERVKKTTGTNATVYINGLYECTNGSCVKYIFANGQRIAARTATGAVYYFHSDHLGSSSVITASNGLNAENLAYYPYGQTEVDTGAVNVPYKYTGQEYDGEIGLYNYNARLYDPVLGRFITADSIVPNPGDPQSFNRYAYVRNNPLRYTDPTGHLSWDDVSDAWEDVKDGASDVAEWVSDNADEIAATAIVATTAAATWYCGGCGVASGALVGEIIGGYGAHSSGGNVLQGVFIGGVAGGITGGMFEAAGIMTAGANPLVQISAKGFVGGTITSVMGGKFETGFMYAAAAATLYWGYTEMVGFEPTMEPGEDNLPNGQYEDSANGGRPPQGSNVAGLNDGRGGFWSQGGPVSHVINATPGGNALAALHDVWMNNITFNLVTNVGAMAPAAVMSYGAQLGGQLAPITVQQSVHDSRHR